MPTGDLVVGSDGELTLTVGRWAKGKLFYIRRYCDVFNTGMKGKWVVRTYIDLFAGPGKCLIETTREEIDGSPLLALNCRVPFTHYFFNDVQPNVVNALRTRAKPYSSANMVFLSRDCNLAVEELLQKLPSNSLDFCFIDPFNWEIKFDSISKLTEKRRMDLAITCHIGSIKRVADRPPKELIDFFPDTSWKQEYEKAGVEGKLSGRVLLDAYGRGLRDLGYEEIKDYVLAVNNRKVPLYYLIFASKHPRGADFWDKVAERSEVGQVRMRIFNGKGTYLSKSESALKIVEQEYRLLNGSDNLLVQRVNDGSIINRFDKTPLPARSTDVVCPHFLELKWAYGCPFDCAWCYLKGTFRFQPTKTKPVFKDYKKIELHTRRFLEEVTTPEIFNTGEIADSLMGEGLSQPFSKFIIPMLEGQNRHKLLFVTKSDNIKHLLEINPHSQAIISFSLNADEVAKKWERGAPSVDRRIEAGRKLSEVGYEVRIRIDPMVPVVDWNIHYISLIEQVFNSFIPSRITLGSLRGLQTTVNGSTDRSWVEYLKENSNWGKKIEFNTRYSMYSTIINYLEERYDYKAVALCKETVAMWNRLGMDYTKMKCNCML